MRGSAFPSRGTEPLEAFDRGGGESSNPRWPEPHRSSSSPPLTPNSKGLTSNLSYIAHPPIQKYLGSTREGKAEAEIKGACVQMQKSRVRNAGTEKHLQQPPPKVGQVPTDPQGALRPASSLQRHHLVIVPCWEPRPWVTLAAAEPRTSRRAASASHKICGEGGSTF